MGGQHGRELSSSPIPLPNPRRLPRGWNGIDTFTYAISDGRGGSDTARVRVRVGSEIWCLSRWSPGGQSTATGVVIGDVLYECFDTRPQPISERETVTVNAAPCSRLTPSAGTYDHVRHRRPAVSRASCDLGRCRSCGQCRCSLGGKWRVVATPAGHRRSGPLPVLRRKGLSHREHAESRVSRPGLKSLQARVQLRPDFPLDSLACLICPLSELGRREDHKSRTLRFLLDPVQAHQPDARVNDHQDRVRRSEITAHRLNPNRDCDDSR